MIYKLLLVLFSLSTLTYAVTIESVILQSVEAEGGYNEAIQQGQEYQCIGTYRIELSLDKKEYPDIVKVFSKDTVAFKVLPMDKKSTYCYVLFKLKQSHKSADSAKKGFYDLLPVVKREVEDLLFPKEKKNAY